MFGSTLVAVAETCYIGRLGIEPLAAIALVIVLGVGTAISILITRWGNS